MEKVSPDKVQLASDRFNCSFETGNTWHGAFPIRWEWVICHASIQSRGLFIRGGSHKGSAHALLAFRDPGCSRLVLGNWLLGTSHYTAYCNKKKIQFKGATLWLSSSLGFIYRRESARKELNSTSGAQFDTLPLVKPVVWFARAVVNWRSRSVAKSAVNYQ